MTASQTPIPAWFDENLVGQLYTWRKQQILASAVEDAKKYGIQPACKDTRQTALLMIDMQVDFCVPPPVGSLFVGGVSGTGALDDAIRAAKFLMTNSRNITKACATLDTHPFHAIHLATRWWADGDGNPVGPFTMIANADAKSGKYIPCGALAGDIAPTTTGRLMNQGSHPWMAMHGVDYTAQLETPKLDANGRPTRDQYSLMVWPAHTLLGDIGHAMIPLYGEAMFYHSCARIYEPDITIKGGNPQVENYSAAKPEVCQAFDGRIVGELNTDFINLIMSSDRVLMGGEAASHCFAWTTAHIILELMKIDPNLPKKLCILSDLTSPVYPGLPNDDMFFVKAAEKAFDDFRNVGCDVLKTTDPIEQILGL